jgi:hypothetical protein
VDLFESDRQTDMTKLMSLFVILRTRLKCNVIRNNSAKMELKIRSARGVDCMISTVNTDSAIVQDLERLYSGGICWVNEMLLVYLFPVRN